MNTNVKEAMRAYGGPLTPEQMQLLRDLEGWIEYCISNGFSLKSTLGPIAHDVNGLLAETPLLKPQVTGYRKYLTARDDLSELANEPNPNDD
jgi:hypothetical protein